MLLIFQVVQHPLVLLGQLVHHMQRSALQGEEDCNNPLQLTGVEWLVVIWALLKVPILKSSDKVVLEF